MTSWTTRLNVNVYMQLTVSENAYSASNYSTFSWSLDLIDDRYAAYNGNNNPWYVQINGSIVASSNSTYNLSAGGSLNLSNGTTGAINHDVNGQLSVAVVGYYDENANVISQTYVATDFNRAPSTPTSVTPTVNANKTITVVIGGVTVPGGSPAAGAVTYYSQYKQDSGSYTGLQSSSTSSIIFSGLVPGHLYTFSGYAANSDGTSNTIYSSSVFLAAGGKRYDGTAWQLATTAKRFDGTTWQSITTAKRYDGAAWVNLS